MSFCSEIKGFVRSHEYVADIFSLLAVLLLFSSIWIIIDFQAPIIDWMRDNILIHGTFVFASIIFDVLLIMAFLSIGSSRFRESTDERCFHTFRGRRHGGFNFGSAFTNWVKHIEQVNKKHR